MTAALLSAGAAAYVVMGLAVFVSASREIRSEARNTATSAMVLAEDLVHFALVFLPLVVFALLWPLAVVVVLWKRWRRT